MASNQTRLIRRTQVSVAVSLAVTSLMTGSLAMAQEAKAPAPTKSTAGETEIAQIMIVGTRASQQSSISRKKNAATAVDSVVAEDVGAFPDRNIGEAISRIAGVALDRGDFGEGINVTVRGSGPSLTRVEIDGQGVMSGAGTDLNGGGDGRGVELRELSSDLIKSVDIVKGSTPDMTEGSLGGGVIIKTRTGLDFNKQFISARVAATQTSLGKKWSPDLNVVYADKFLDGRLGIIANVTRSNSFNEGHSQELTTTGAGYARAIDFDHSPEKTFSYNPALLSATNPIVDQPTGRWPITAAGGGELLGNTPREILTKSGAAADKAGCVAAFPDFTTAQLAGLSDNNKKIAVVHRGNERMSCLNQWNDYTPMNLRNIIKTQEDKRLSGDLRLDFKVNDKLSVYVKGSKGTRTVNDAFMTYGLGQMRINSDSTVQPGYSGAAFITQNGNRVAAPNSGYYTYDTPSFTTSNTPYSQTSAVNVNPASVVVDKGHHVTKFTISDGATSTDQIANVIKTDSQYMQAGATYRDGGLKVELMLGDAKAKWRRGDLRVGWGVAYGAADLSVAESGLWDYTFNGNNPLAPTNFDAFGVARPANVATNAVPADANVPVAIPAYTIAQQPLRTIAPNITFRPRMGDSQERTAKLDLSYALSDRIPLFQNIKSGFNFRTNSGNSWGGGGYAVSAAVGEFGKAGYVPRVQVPTANLTTNIIGCQDTPGSLGPGGQPCQYGYNTKTNPTDVLSGNIVMTPAEFQKVLEQSMSKPSTAQFFGGMPDRSPTLLNNWSQIDVAKAFALAGGKNANYDCVKECVASDGKLYAQPVSTFEEKINAMYLMTDFDLTTMPFTNWSLPFGMEMDGNFGWRVVKTDVKATGNVGFTSILKTANFNPLAPNAAGGTVTTTVTRATALEASTTDYMPILNLALWPIKDQVVLRYNRAKTIARPPVGRLFPTGTCTYDQRREDQDLDMNCGTIGNPALKPQVNINQNFSIEWYPNKDTMLSLGRFIHRGIIGPFVTVGKTNALIFAGTGLTDPATGKPLDDMEFSYPTYENGPAIKRKGFEFASKTAFTFLPSVLRHTGLDANYTKLESAASTVTIRDLLTGDVMPARDEPAYSYNASLWYDDGAFTARIALQVVAEVFSGIAADAGATNVNNFPNDAGGRITVLPYNPGSPNFKSATRYVDAKIAYRFKNGIELFAEGRNLGKSTTGNHQGAYAPFEGGTPSLMNLKYPGRKIMIGMNIKH